MLADRLVEHLANWLGDWPPDSDVVVTSSPFRELPGWDGKTRAFAGVASPAGAVLSVPSDALDTAREVARVTGFAGLERELGALLGTPGHRLRSGIFRWCQSLVEFEDLGEWVSRDDERLPQWLAPFNGDVLVVFSDDGAYAAGLGRKRHDQYCQEIAVGTEEAYRGRGLAKRLVAKAARRIYEEGSVAVYQHAASNESSARVAEASGFPDLGWKSFGLSST